MSLCPNANRRGTADYQAGRHEQALVHFQRQVDYADTALEEFAFNDTEPTAKAIAAREVALNNVALGHLKNGECLKARCLAGSGGCRRQGDPRQPGLVAKELRSTTEAEQHHRGLLAIRRAMAPGTS